MPRKPASIFLRALLATGFTLIFVTFVLGRSNRFGFICGWSHATSFREEAGEGGEGEMYSLGSVPGRVMIGSNEFDSEYPNDLPPGTPRVTSESSEWFFEKNEPATGFLEEADPTTYPVHFGFAWMNRSVAASSHSHQHYHVLILSHGLIVAAAIALGGLLVLRRLHRRRVASSRASPLDFAPVAR